MHEFACAWLLLPISAPDVLQGMGFVPVLESISTYAGWAERGRAVLKRKGTTAKLKLRSKPHQGISMAL